MAVEAWHSQFGARERQFWVLIMLSDYDHDWAQGPRGVGSGLFPLYLWAWGGM